MSISIKRKAFAFTMIFAMLLTLLFASVTAFADTMSEEEALNNLTDSVRSEVSSNTYQAEGGGYVMGSDLFVQIDNTGRWDLDEDVFKTLSVSAQSDLVSDIAEASNGAVGSDGITESTVQNWWKQLQSKDGVGTQFLTEILKNTKPDFVTANQIYAPFSGFVGTVMGLIAVMLMAFLGIVMVLDISYIVLPPVRNFVSDSDGGRGGKMASSKLFSHDALYAVKQAEQSSAGDGEPKQALGIYLKRRIIALIILGVCLLYLIQGQIYTLVMWILNLLRGFLGF